MRDNSINIKLRDVINSDLETLSSIKPTKALHSDRIRDADNGYIRYLVAEKENNIVGFGLVVFKSPPTWTKMNFLPAIIDLYVKPNLRSQGVGTSMINEFEKTALNYGYKEIFIGVDPNFNQRAYSLYLRLGYKPLSEEPFLEHWSLAISDGSLREGDNWIIYMRKDLLPRN